MYDELTGQAPKEQTTEVTSASINMATTVPSKTATDSTPVQISTLKSNSLLTTSQVEKCIKLGAQLDQLKSQHKTIADNADYEREENKLHNDDMKEIEKEITALDKKISYYLDRLESYRQPVPDYQRDEFNQFKYKYDTFGDRAFELEDVLDDVKKDLNQSAKNFHELRKKSGKVTREVNLLIDTVYSQCFNRNQGSNLDAIQQCKNKQNNYFCKSLKNS